MGRKTSIIPLVTQAIGYLRVSTDEQSLSLEAQQATVTRWCAQHACVLLAVYADVHVSGGAKLEKRPGLLTALEALTPGTVLLATKRDRLARDAMAAAMIERLAERASASVQTCDGVGEGESPEAKLMRGMIDLFAEYERQVIKARIKTALGHKKAKQERVSGRGCHTGSSWELMASIWRRTPLSKPSLPVRVHSMRLACRVGPLRPGWLTMGSIVVLVPYLPRARFWPW